MDIEERIMGAKQKIMEAEKRKARAEAQKDQAKETFIKATGKLESVFHVTSIPAAKDLLKDVQIKLDEVVCGIEETLENLEK